MRMAILIALQVLLASGAPAAELSPDLRALIEGFQAHRRVAIGYLRTRNTDLGVVEIERLRERWASDRARLAPAAAADPALTAALARTELMLADGLKAADRGDDELAGRLLGYAAAPLTAWRRAKQIRLFSDCIEEISVAWQSIEPYRRETPDLGDGVIAAQVAARADIVAGTINRCDREAGEGLRGQPEFRRLIDGMLASLRQLPDAIAARDGALLQRLLIEQHSFVQLLEFRFG